MITQQDKDDFWIEVEDCLINIYNLDKVEAQRRITKLRYDIEHPILDSIPIDDIDSDLIYHSEPSDIADDLAQWKTE